MRHKYMSQKETASTKKKDLLVYVKQDLFLNNTTTSFESLSVTNSGGYYSNNALKVREIIPLKNSDNLQHLLIVYICPNINKLKTFCISYIY